MASFGANEIKDLYLLSYKRSNKARANVARETGLEPFGKMPKHRNQYI